MGYLQRKKKISVWTAVLICALIFSLSPLNADRANAAPERFIPVKSITYNGHIYSLYDISCTWHTARDYAEKMGGHLVTLNTEEERVQVVNLMRAAGGKSSYWTDATDDGTEGQWRWDTGETGYAWIWKPGEPSNTNFGGYHENFGVISKSDGMFNDLVSNFSDLSSLGFIVEIDNYSYLKSATYGNNRYLLFDKIPRGSMTWEMAMQFCERIGGHLATITSEGEEAAMEALIRDSGKTWLFIGATDAGTEGKWRWVTGEPFAYSNWGVSYDGGTEPNGGTAGNYACIAVPGVYRTGTWDDTNLNPGSRTGFICEFEPAKEVRINDHLYRFYDKSMTWKDAKATCESAGGHLVTIGSAGEQSALEAALGGKNYWIGATNEATGGKWQWITGEAYSYTKWQPGEPNNEGQVEYFALMGHKGSGGWIDTANLAGYGTLTAGFICEFEPAAKPATPVTPVTPAAPKPAAGTKFTIKYSPYWGKQLITKTWKKKWSGYFKPKPTAKTVAYGKAYGALPASKKSPFGYTFAGWWTAATGGEKITAKSTVKITKNTTIYARWVPKKIKAVFKLQGVKDTTKKVSYGKPYGKLPVYVDKTRKFTFLGWYTKRSGGVKVTSTTVVKTTKTVTLYGRWKRK